MPACPLVTVAMPCLNEAEHIGTVLSQLLAQKFTRGRMRIVIADGGSTDGTVDAVLQFAARHPEVELLRNPGRFAGSARNLAALSGRFDVFVVVDAHCHIPDEYFIEHVLDALDESGAYCLSRPQPIRPDGERLSQRASAVARASWLGHCPGSLIYDTECRDFVSAVSAAQIYRREVFETVGLFVEHLGSCEDLEFNVRVENAGLSTFHCPRTILEYHPRENIAALFYHMFRYGEGRLRVAAMHRRSVVSLTGVLPALFVLWLLFGPVLHRFAPTLASLHSASLVIYALVLIGESVRQGFAHGPGVALALPLEFLAIHLGWGIGQISAVVKRLGTRDDPIDAPRRFAVGWNDAATPSDRPEPAMQRAAD